MNEFWKWLLQFLNEHWQDLALGAGIAYNALKCPKTAEQRKTAKSMKADKKAEKAVKKAELAVNKAKELKENA